MDDEASEEAGAREETNRLVAQRRKKLAQLREQGQAYPNDVRRSDWAGDLQNTHATTDKALLAEQAITVGVAGRILLNRGAFVVIQDMTGRIQLYVNRKTLDAETLTAIKQWDLGDVVAGEGVLARSNKGDLYVDLTAARLVVKALRPLPEKFHGLADTEMKYRQRYVDLIVNEQTRSVFQTRSQVIQIMREFLCERRFLEVETPMMHGIPGGAAARPFVTHHNALDMDLYLRVAPELYLKRLVVGGFERVFEINRNFRNEGLSTRHNPEFTMLEFYCSFADYRDLMDLTETLLRKMIQQVTGALCITYQGETFDFEPSFQRITVRDSLLEYEPTLTADSVDDVAAMRAFAQQCGIDVKDTWGLGRLHMELFEERVESRLKGPVFVTQYPTEVSPLARRQDGNPEVTDRFEFFLGGREIANGFSELNDPDDQAARFREQVAEKEAGDLEAMHFDADYIQALEFGLPPTAGEGIGIDRLVMFLTDSPSIRDVILFPLLRPVKEQ
ncbi:MAG: lysine--tRNA ligase [Gammaproteobacteria bacterium]